MISSVAGVGAMVSPFFSPREMSSIRKISAGRQTPAKSTLPFARRGAGWGAAFGEFGGACAPAAMAMSDKTGRRMKDILFSDHVNGALFVFVANVLHQFHPRPPGNCVAGDPGLGI